MVSVAPALGSARGLSEEPRPGLGLGGIGLARRPGALRSPAPLASPPRACFGVSVGAFQETCWGLNDGPGLQVGGERSAPRSLGGILGCGGAGWARGVEPGPRRGTRPAAFLPPPARAAPAALRKRFHSRTSGGVCVRSVKPPEKPGPLRAGTGRRSVRAPSLFGKGPGAGWHPPPAAAWPVSSAT